MAYFDDTANSETLIGGADNDWFQIQHGGVDSVSGGGGDDFVQLLTPFTPLSHFDLGDGQDTIHIAQSNLGAVVFGAQTIVGVELLDVDAANFDITLNDANIAAGQSLQITASTSAADDHHRLDASAETDGSVSYVSRSTGNDFVGGAGDDEVQLSSVLASDRLVGGSGHDVLRVDAFATVFEGETLSGFEALQVSGAVTMSDDNLAAHQVLAVSGGSLQFNGRAERDGAYDVSVSSTSTLHGGAGDDTLSSASSSADVLIGHRGADSMSGGEGNDTFAYWSVTDSRKKAPDKITDFSAGDGLDLHRLDADTTTAGDQAFTIVDAFSRHAGELVMTFNETTGWTTAKVDVDGDKHADMTVLLHGEVYDVFGFVL